MLNFSLNIYFYLLIAVPASFKLFVFSHISQVMTHNFYVIKIMIITVKKNNFEII